MSVSRDTSPNTCNSSYIQKVQTCSRSALCSRDLSSAASVVFPAMLSDPSSEMLGNLPFHVLRPNTIHGAELCAAGMREGWKLQQECVCCNEKQTRRSPLPSLLRRFGFPCRQQNHEYLNGKGLPLNINQKLIDSITDLIFEMFETAASNERKNSACGISSHVDNECIKNSPWVVGRAFGRERSLDVCSVTLHLEESQKRGFTQPSEDQDTGEKNAVGEI